MSLSHLKISNFRNIIETDILFHEKCNLFYGDNGAGKTSILEALYYLGMGRSFRTRYLNKIITKGAKKFSLFGEMANDEGIMTVGMEHDGKNRSVKLGGISHTSRVELIKMMPLKLINHNGYKLLEYAKFRRRFLDWGLFHVEQQYGELWKRMTRLVAQRNAALRDEKQLDNILIWNAELTQVCLEINFMREQYLEKIIPMMKKMVKEFLGQMDFKIIYYRGWGEYSDLNSVLNKDIERDRQMGFTKNGSHMADLYLRFDGALAHDILSRGQQKILFVIMALIQGTLFERLSGKNCTYLIDDFSAELDNETKEKMANILIKLRSQIFITGLQKDDMINFFPVDKKMFHVKKGDVLSTIL